MIYLPHKLWDAFFIGVHNAELTQQTANLMDKYNQIADKIAENGYIATWCTENYARLLVLKSLFSYLLI